jgi:hypothetical protein
VLTWDPLLLPAGFGGLPEILRGIPLTSRQRAAFDVSVNIHYKDIPFSLPLVATITKSGNVTGVESLNCPPSNCRPKAPYIIGNGVFGLPLSEAARVEVSASVRAFGTSPYFVGTKRIVIHPDPEKVAKMLEQDALRILGGDPNLPNLPPTPAETSISKDVSYTISIPGVPADGTVTTDVAGHVVPHSSDLTAHQARSVILAHGSAKTSAKRPFVTLTIHPSPLLKGHHAAISATLTVSFKPKHGHASSVSEKITLPAT